MVVLDLKRAFHHVPIRGEDRDYFAFQFKGRVYRWCTLPFGWGCSPYYHTKVLRPAIAYLRSLGIQIVFYSDNILLMASPEQMIEHKDIVMKTLTQLCWTINWEKSQLSPANTCQFIGYILCTEGDHPYQHSSR